MRVRTVENGEAWGLETEIEERLQRPDGVAVDDDDGASGRLPAR